MRAYAKRGGQPFATRGFGATWYATLLATPKCLFCTRLCIKNTQIIATPLIIHFMLVLIAYKASAHDCFMSPQVSLQNSTGQLTIVEFGTDMVISLPPWCKHIAALTGWMVQRRKGMKQVALGCPKPVGDGTFLPLVRSCHSWPLRNLENPFSWPYLKWVWSHQSHKPTTTG